MKRLKEAIRSPYAWIMSVVAVGFCVTAAVAHDPGDFKHMLDPANSIANGDLGAAYPKGASGTSLGGWLLLTLPFYVPLRALVGSELGWSISGLVAVPIALAGVAALVRSLSPSGPRDAAWKAATASLFLPTTLACWFEWYHPQDLAGAGLMLLGLAAAVRGRWVLAGGLLGLAVVTRQWVGLVAVLVAPFAGTAVIGFGLAGVAVVAALSLPLVLTGNPGFIEAATGQTAARSRNTLLGRLTWLDLTNEVLPRLIRLVPAAMGVVTSLVLWAKRVRGVRWMLTAAMVGLVLRLSLEPAAFVYYWVPVPLLVLGLVGRSRVAYLAAAILGVAPALIPWLEDVASGVLVPGLIFSLSGFAVLAVWSLAGEDVHTDSDQSPSGLTGGVDASVQQPVI